MASKINDTIIIKSIMNLNELEKAENTIKKFDHKYELRASKTPIAESLGKAFVIYKKTFSERSFGKLNTLKNYVLHKNLSNSELLKKNIFDRNSISVKDLKKFLTERIKIESHLKVYIENNPISTEKKSFNEETNINLENNAQTQKNNPTGLKENASPDKLMELANELGLEGITLDYLKSATNIKTESHKNNQKEVKSIIQDDDLMKMLDDLQGDEKADELDAILNEFKENSPDDEMDAILNEFKKDSPHNKLDAILNELNINSPDGDLDKNLEELENLTAPQKDSQSKLTKPTLNNNPKELGASAKDTNVENPKDKFEAQSIKINFKPPSPTKDNLKLAKRVADTLELRYALKEMGLGDNGAIEKLKPRDKNNIGTDNNLKNSPTIIKQKHIANLETAIDLGQIQFDKTKPNYNQLNRQKEIVETTIKLIASTSTLKKSESISVGRGSLTDLKLELLKEFNILLGMATENNYKQENLSQRFADLNTALEKIEFIPEEKSNWF